MQLKLVITMNNAAFADDGDNGRSEAARILKEAADQLENNSQDQRGLFDINGNRVGGWKIVNPT